MKTKKMARILRILPVTLLALAAQPLWAQTAFVANPSFESDYNTNYPFYSSTPGNMSSIDGWTGGSGVNENPLIAEANGQTVSYATAWGTIVENIADRDRVAFMQGNQTLSQDISGLTPGKQYWLQFWYQGRNCCGGTLELDVSFSGVQLASIPDIVGPNNNLLTSGYYFANFSFTATNDTGTLAFQSVVPSGDATVGIDAVNIVQRDAGNVVLMNPSFEASGPPTTAIGNPPAPDSGEIIKPAPMAGWLWDTNQTGTYGISLSGGVYADNGAIPDQALVGFISGPGSLSQAVSNLFVGGTYQLSFACNAQSAPKVNAHLQVVVGGAVIDDEAVAPVGGSNPYHTKTATFTPTNATEVITFAQTNATGTLLLDDVSLVGKVPPSLFAALPKSGTSYLAPPPLQLVIAQGSAAIDTSTLKILLNGTDVTAKATVTQTNSPVGIAVTYAYPTLPPGTNTVEFTVSDKSSPAITLSDTFTFITQAPISFTPLTQDLAMGQTGQLEVIVSSSFLASSSADISLSMASPAVASIVGADTNGILALHFAQGATNVQSFQVVGLSGGSSSVNVTAPALLGVVQAPVVSVFVRLVINPSFEDSTGTNPIPAWTGGSGVETATGLNLDNGILPDRTQVAVMKGANTLSQQIYGLAPGENYWLQFRYNASYGDSQAGSYGMDLKVKLGGKLLVTITNIGPAGFSLGDVPFYFTNIVFVPTNASELLEFDTTPTTANTTPALLLDAVSMVQRDTNEVVIENPDFVASGEAAYPTYVSGQVDGWQIAGGGHGCNSSAGPFLDNGVAPEQGEALFMQGNGTISNAISGPLTVGQVYTLSYSVNRRAYSATATMTYSAGFGDIPLVTGETLTAAGDSNPFLTEYLIFTNDAPSQVLGFATTAVGDASFLVSAIHLAPGLRIPPEIVSESPVPVEGFVSPPPLQFVLTQGSYPLNTTNLQLWLNGTNVAASATVTPTNNGIIISYTYPKLPPGTNSVQLIVSDQNTPPMTVTTSFTFVIVAPPALVLSVGAMMDPTAGTVDVGVGFNNTVDDAAGSLLANYSISSGTIASLTWATNRFTADSTNPLVTVRKQSALLRVTGLSGNSGTLTIKNVTDTYGNTISSTNIAFTVASNLTWGNVGANQLGGWQAAVPVAPGGFDIYSDGIAEWGTYDETTFVYEQVTGDFDKKLRVEYQDGSSEWGRAGIVVRDVLNFGVDSAIQTGSGATAPPYDGKAGRYQKCHVNPVGATLTGNPPGALGNANWEGNRRLDTGGASTSADTNAAHVPLYPNAWCRIQRKGQTFTIFRSDDGVNWVTLGATTWGVDDQTKTPMPDTLYVGPEYSPENGNISVVADQGTFLAQFRDYGDFAFNPQLTIAFSAGKVTVTWTAGTLVSSPTLNGTYAPVTGATSPYVVSPSGQAMFYRVMQ